MKMCRKTTPIEERQRRSGWNTHTHTRQFIIELKQIILNGVHHHVRIAFGRAEFNLSTCIQRKIVQPLKFSINTKWNQVCWMYTIHTWTVLFSFSPFPYFVIASTIVEILYLLYFRVYLKIWCCACSRLFHFRRLNTCWFVTDVMNLTRNVTNRHRVSIS